MIGGRKVVGSAQLRQGGALLQHGSILLEDNQGFVVGLTQGASLASTPSDPAGPRGPSPTPPFRIAGGRRGESPARPAPAGPVTGNRIPIRAGAEGAPPNTISHYRSPAWTWAR